MGHYTELIFGARLKKDAPKEVVETMKYLVDGGDEPENLLFDDTKYRNPLRGGSYYFAICNSVGKMWFDTIANQWCISTRANIKNSDDDIETFLGWVRPFLDDGSGGREMYAIVIGEDQDIPEIYYLEDHGDFEDAIVI